MIVVYFFFFITSFSGLLGSHFILVDRPLGRSVALEAVKSPDDRSLPDSWRRFVSNFPRSINQ